MYRVSWLTISACLLCVSCKTLNAKGDSVRYSPSAKTDWKRAPWSSADDTSNATKGKGSGTKEDLRRRVVSMANGLLTKAEERSSFGEEDVDRVLTDLQVKVPWHADQDLARLVAHARKIGAYRATGTPLPGDIVLFHNQRDRNANSRNDDWLTGAGIVVAVRGDLFDAVTRTGHAPRRITVSPSDPSHRISGDSVINSFVRPPSKADPKDTVYLAGQLYAGHIDLEKLAAE